MFKETSLTKMVFEPLKEITPDLCEQCSDLFGAFATENKICEFSLVYCIEAGIVALLVEDDYYVTISGLLIKLVWCNSQRDVFGDMNYYKLPHVYTAYSCAKFNKNNSLCTRCIEHRKEV